MPDTILDQWRKLREEEAVLQRKIAFELRMGNKDAINILLAEIAGVYLRLKELREPPIVPQPL